MVGIFVANFCAVAASKMIEMSNLVQSESKMFALYLGVVYLVVMLLQITGESEYIVLFLILGLIATSSI